LRIEVVALLQFILVQKDLESMSKKSMVEVAGKVFPRVKTMVVFKNITKSLRYIFTNKYVGSNNMVLITPRDNSTDDVRMRLFVLFVENDVMETFTNLFIIRTYVQLQYVL
jgi:hypothetical protein